jgi:hypothetical protein
MVGTDHELSGDGCPVRAGPQVRHVAFSPASARALTSSSRLTLLVPPDSWTTGSDSLPSFPRQPAPPS